MKRMIFIVVMLSTFASEAQVTTSSLLFPENRGNGNARNWALRQNNSAEGDFQIGHRGTNTGLLPDFLATPADAKVTIKSNGDVGIGMTTPWGKFHVNGVGYFGNENATAHRIAIGGSGTNYGSVGYGYRYTQNDFLHNYAASDFASQLRFDVGGFNFLTAPSGTSGSPITFTSVMVINQNGNVGIGTSVPPDAKLAVKGIIHTQEVRVDLLGAVAPDYVFEPDYDLTTLDELKGFIQQHKHLPEIPSATEMEANGINLKEMNLLLLKKVEELTLLLIEEHVKVERLEREVSELQVCQQSKR